MKDIIKRGKGITWKPTYLIERIFLSPVALETTDEIKKEACTKMVQASSMSLGKL